MQLDLEVFRVSDRARFTLTLPYQEETIISHLQPGVQYCVTVRVSTPSHAHSVAGPPVCTLTSPPVTRSSERLLLGSLGACCGLAPLLAVLLLCCLRMRRRGRTQAPSSPCSSPRST